MQRSFGQFCPVALASEVLTQRWMLLVLRELSAGATRFNEIRRGVPRISASLLKDRLETLEHAEVVERRRIGNSDVYEYFLTKAGIELKSVLAQIGEWGQRWARDIRPEDLEPGWARLEHPPTLEYSGDASWQDGDPDRVLRCANKSSEFLACQSRRRCRGLPKASGP